MVFGCYWAMWEQAQVDFEKLPWRLSSVFPFAVVVAVVVVVVVAVAVVVAVVAELEEEQSHLQKTVASTPHSDRATYSNHSLETFAHSETTESISPTQKTSFYQVDSFWGFDRPYSKCSSGRPRGVGSGRGR